MNNKQTNSYMLIIFNQPADEEGFIKPTAQELTVIADTNDVKYYFNENMSMYTFDTTEDVADIKEYLGLMLEDLDIHHILTPYDENEINVFLPKHVTKHMFNSYKHKEDIYQENMSEHEIEEFNQNILKAKEFFKSLEEDEEVFELIPKVRKKQSLNNILDKIVDYGMSSITQTEKEILETYSKL